MSNMILLTKTLLLASCLLSLGSTAVAASDGPASKQTEPARPPEKKLAKKSSLAGKKNSHSHSAPVSKDQSGNSEKMQQPMQEDGPGPQHPPSKSKSKTPPHNLANKCGAGKSSKTEECHAEPQ
jgi:hypothetical protein